jgi:Zn-dependent protease with chaperone function
MLLMLWRGKIHVALIVIASFLLMATIPYVLRQEETACRMFLVELLFSSMLWLERCLRKEPALESREVALDGWDGIVKDEGCAATVGALPLWRAVQELAAAEGLSESPLVRVNPLRTKQASMFSRPARPYYALVFSRGILRALDEEEVKAIAAHEFAHGANPYRYASCCQLLHSLRSLLTGFAFSLCAYIFLAEAADYTGLVDVEVETELVLQSLAVALLYVYVWAPRSVSLIWHEKEIEADLGAAQRTGSAELVIKALSSLGLDCEERSINELLWYKEDDNTHPSLRRRVRCLRLVRKRTRK